MAKLSEIKTFDNPFSDLGVGEDDHTPIENVLNEDIEIKDVRAFENTKGPGVYVAFTFQKEDHTRLRYFCTHSSTITGKLSDAKVLEVLDDGECIECRVIRRKSTKSDRMVYDLE